MVFDNIVLAFDGSSHAKVALKKAVELAQLDPEVKVHIVNITANHNAQLASSLNTMGFDPEMFQLSPEDIIAIHDKAVAKEMDKIQHIVDALIAPVAEQVEIAILPGNDPANQLMDYAANVNADLIIMGSRGLGAIRGVLGSVSYAVLRESPIPVLVVK